MQFSNVIRAISLILILTMTGCASGYKSFYKPAPSATPETIAARRASPPPSMPLIERAQPGDWNAILDAYAKRGYVMIGESFFNSGRSESEEGAIQQAQQIGADIVLILNPKYTGSVTSSIPITTPTSTTSYSSATATAYGPGGTVNAYGTGTTQTYGSKTEYVPVTVHRSDYGAVFFVKQRFTLGAFLRELNNTERQEIQTNKGAVIKQVVDGTPAFNSDLLVGDIITAVDGIPVINTATHSDLLSQRRGKTITLSIIRSGKSLEKQVQLNP
jgi:hypothetical protein